MARIYSPWTRQPQYPAQINRRHPYAPTLGLWLPGSGVVQNLVSGVLSSTNAASVVVDTRGRKLSFDGANNFVNTGIRDVPAAISFIVICSGDAIPSAANNASMFHSEPYGINWNHTNAAYRGGATLNVGATYPNVLYGTLNAGQTYHLGMSWDGATLKAFKDGVLIGSVAASGALTSDPAALMFGQNSASIKLACKVEFAYLTARALPDRAFKELFDNVYQLLQAPSRVIPVGLALTSPVFDSASSSAYQASVSTYSWNHTVGTQANRVLEVSVSVFLTGTVSSVTYGGVALTQNTAATIANGAYRSEVWQLIAPTSGTAAIVVTLSASLTSVGSAESYYNVDQLTPVEATATASGTGATAAVSITTIVNNSVVLANLAASSASGITSATGQTNRSSSQGALGSDRDDEKGPITPAASTTVTWNNLGAVDTWAASAISLRALGIKGDVARTLAGVTSTATGTLALAGVVSSSLSNATSVSSGTLAITGTLSSTLDNVTSAATGTLALSGSLSATLANATSAAAGTLALAGVVSPALGGMSSVSTGTIALVGTLSSTLDGATLVSTGVLASPGTGAANIVLDGVTLSSSATLSVTGSVSVTLDTITSVASGLNQTPIASSSSGGWAEFPTLRRSKEDVRADRVKLGITNKTAQQIIAKLAESQIKTLEDDQATRERELKHQIILQGLEWQERYLKALNDERERLIKEEIKNIIILEDYNNDIMALILISAAA